VRSFHRVTKMATFGMSIKK